jgi:hypothetical protein
MHLQADHLSLLSEEKGTSPMDDRLVDDNLFVVTVQPEWYIGIVKFLTTQKLSGEWTRENKKKLG